MLETIMLKKSLSLFLLLFTSTSALAASAVTQADLNLRTGPGVGYQPITTVPVGRTVAVFGCLDQGRWCDVSWNGYRGWLSGTYLGAVHVRVPIITYDPVVYERYYVGQPYYNPRAAARRDARIEYRVQRRMDRRWERWTD